MFVCTATSVAVVFARAVVTVFFALTVKASVLVAKVVLDSLESLFNNVLYRKSIVLE